MPGMFPEISASSAGSNPGATNWLQQLSADVALAVNTDTLLFTQAAPAAGTYVIAVVLTINHGTSDQVSVAIEVAGTPVATTTMFESSNVADTPVTVQWLGTLSGSQAVTIRATATVASTVKAASVNYAGNVASTFLGFRIN